MTNHLIVIDSFVLHVQSVTGAPDRYVLQDHYDTRIATTPKLIGNRIGAARTSTRQTGVQRLRPR